MGGDISVSFRREPNYFLGCCVQGECSEIIKCTESDTGRIVGLGARHISEMNVNGVSKKVGYLADLRIEPNVRNGTILARGYHYLRTLQSITPVDYHYSMVLANNVSALDIVTSGRAGLPRYSSMGKVLSPAIFLDLPKRAINIKGIHFSKANTSNVNVVFDFIQKQYKRKQFSPVYHSSDLMSGRLRGLLYKDIYIAYRGNTIVGTIAAWDQGKFRQTHIESYSKILRFIRPVHNALSTLTPLKQLPQLGSHIPYVYFSLMAVLDDDINIFRALLRHVYRERRRGSWHYAVAGIHEDSALAEVIKEYRHISSSGELYSIDFEERGASLPALDDRTPHVEIASI
ncbi:MAG: hypothetical protein COB94_005735 [Gammaproteobacteria bacterium]|nr:hypothetical protein [Gammaproteobacteria bacterium]